MKRVTGQLQRPRAQNAAWNDDRVDGAVAILALEGSSLGEVKDRMRLLGAIPVEGGSAGLALWGFASVAEAVSAGLSFEGRAASVFVSDPSVVGLGPMVWAADPPGSSFVGRVEEVAACAVAIEKEQIVTLTGPGGSGKTRLAARVAAEIGPLYADGVYWVDLTPVTAPSSLPLVVGRALGLWLETEPDPAAELGSYLAGGARLIVIDNCEHLLESCRQLCQSLAAVAPTLRVLATSREALGATTETIIAVPPLAVSDTAVDVDQSDAGRLFEQRARAVRPNFTISSSNATAVWRICRRLDGMPLAIELAAARVRLLSPEQIAAGLDEGFALLGTMEGPLPRHRTLEASVRWSYDLCASAEQILLRRLSVFAGTFDLDAIEAVCDFRPLDRYGILDVLDRLIDRSLVSVVDHGDDRRYRLLETVRVFALEQLEPSGDLSAVKERHLDHFHSIATLAEQAIPRTGGLSWLPRLDEDYPNLVAALESADQTRAADALLGMATALVLFWEMRGRFSDGAAWMDRALALQQETSPEPSPARARGLWGRAHLAIYAADFPTAMSIAPDALALADAVGEPVAGARLRNTLGFATCYTDPNAATAILNESIAVGLEAGDDWAVADSTKFLTVARLIAADIRGCEAAVDQLSTVATRIGNSFFLGWCDGALGYCHLLRGQFVDAIASFDRSMEAATDVGDPATRGIVQAWRAYALCMLGRYDDARAEATDCLTNTIRQGGGLGAPFARVALGWTDLAQGHIDTALATLSEAAEWTRSVGDTFSALWAVPLYGQALCEAARLDEADSFLQVATALAGPPIDNPWSMTRAHFAQALLARERGDNSGAEQLFHQALAIDQRHGFDADAVGCLLELAVIASAAQSWQESARLLGAAEGLADQLDLVFIKPQLARAATANAESRQEIGDDRFESALHEGKQLSLPDAIAYAARARGARGRPIRGWNSLTPTESQVVGCVAEGLTNPAIAERLLMSRATVKTHLSHVFTKLGITSRAELAAAAVRQAAVDSTRSTGRQEHRK